MDTNTLKLLTAASRNLENSDRLVITTPVTTLVAQDIQSEPKIDFRESILPEEIYYEDEVALFQNELHTLLIIGDLSIKPDEVWLPPTESGIEWIGGKLPVSMVYWISNKLWHLGGIYLKSLRLSWLKYASHTRTYLLKVPEQAAEDLIPDLFVDFWP